MSLLETRQLSKHFGGVRAVDGVDLSFDRGGITGIIGPNGAGKTTLFNLLCGVLVPSEGAVHFQGQNLTGWTIDRIARRGMARTFQNLELFAGMTVRENALVGAHRHLRAGVISSTLRLPRHLVAEREARRRADEALARVNLSEHAETPATSLPYGLQRRTELARAIASAPDLLLLDEPMAGLSGPEAENVGGMVRDLIDDGLTVLLVEHDMETVMTLSDRVVVINFGRVLADGHPADVQADPAVVEAYLGADEDEEIA